MLLSSPDFQRRILITGITSIHGWPIYKRLLERSHVQPVFGIRPPKMKIPLSQSCASICITDKSALQKIKSEFKPTHIIHGAGVCDLDVCEERPQWAKSLNTDGASVIADVFGNDCYVMYLSSDLVFSGINTPKDGYRESDIPNPVSVAGQTIADAEKEVARCKSYSVIRLGLPIGNSITGDKGAVDFIDNRFRRGLPMTLFYDEWRSCIDCDHIADIISTLLHEEYQGLLHCGGPSAVSLYNVGMHVLDNGEYSRHLLKGIMCSEEVNGPPRMRNVSLDSSKLLSLFPHISITAPIRGYLD